MPSFCHSSKPLPLDLRETEKLFAAFRGGNSREKHVHARPLRGAFAAFAESSPRKAAYASRHLRALKGQPTSELAKTVKLWSKSDRRYNP